MNILTLNTPTGDQQLAQGMADKFLRWIDSTNTDLSTLSSTEIYHWLHKLNSDSAGIVRRDVLESAYQGIISARAEQDEEVLLPTDVQPREGSQTANEDDPDKLLPAGIQPKKDNNHGTGK